MMVTMNWFSMLIYGLGGSVIVVCISMIARAGRSTTYRKPVQRQTVADIRARLERKRA